MTTNSTEPVSTATGQSPVASAGDHAGANTQTSPPSSANLDPKSAPTASSDSVRKSGIDEGKIKSILEKALPGASLIYIESLSSQSYARDVSTEYISAGRDAFVRSNYSKGNVEASDMISVFSGDLDKWFRAQDDSHFSLSWLLALAVLEGCDVTTIAVQSGLLHTVFAGADARGRRAGARRAETVGQILTRLGAHRATPVSGDGVHLEREVALFDDPAWRSICLIGIWREIELAPSRIASWLMELSASTSPQVRQIAPRAIAILLEHDPHAVFDTIILPLSDGNAAQRWIAADALGLARKGKRSAFVAARLVESARLLHGEGAASVAALCVGDTIAREDPERAAELTLLLIEHWREPDMALYVAFQGLVQHARANERSGTAILRALAGWQGWSSVSSNGSSAQHLHSAIEAIVGGQPDVTNGRNAADYLKRRAALRSEPQSRTPTIAAEIVSFVASAILDLSDVRADRTEDQSTASPATTGPGSAFDARAASEPSPFARLAAQDPGVTSAAAEILVKLLQFAASRQAAWAILREGLKWSNDIKMLASVSLLKQFYVIAPKREVVRLREHLERWKKHGAIADTLEFYVQSQTRG